MSQVPVSPARQVILALVADTLVGTASGRKGSANVAGSSSSSVKKA